MTSKRTSGDHDIEEAPPTKVGKGDPDEDLFQSPGPSIVPDKGQAILQLKDIFPQKIEVRVLETQQDFRDQIELTVKTRLGQCLSSDQTSYEELNLELPEAYKRKLDHDLLQRICALFFEKVKKAKRLQLPNLNGIEKLIEMIKHNNLNISGDYEKIIVPFLITGQHCYDLSIELINNCSSIQEIHFQPSYSKNKDKREVQNLVSRIKKNTSRDIVIKIDSPKNGKTIKETTNKTAYTFDQCYQGPQLGGQYITFTAYDYWDISHIHEMGITGEDITVAVVDSGLDYSHPAFYLKENIEFKDCTRSVLGTNDTDGHGTMCAGIICGDAFEYSKNPDSNAEVEMLETFPPGIANKGKLVVYKVFSGDNASSEAICAALQDIERRGDIDVVSLSLGSLAFTFSIAEAISNLVSKRVIVVCAASNYGNKYIQPIAFPARLGHVLCIGSHDKNGKTSRFSPIGQQIDFLAPGEEITAPCSTYYHHYIDINSGTSFAAPAVAGLICLILGYIKKRYPDVLRHFKCHWVMKELLREISTSPGRPTDDQGFGALDPRRFFKQPVRFVEYIMSEVVDKQ